MRFPVEDSKTIEVMQFLEENSLAECFYAVFIGKLQNDQVHVLWRRKQHGRLFSAVSSGKQHKDRVHAVS